MISIIDEYANSLVAKVDSYSEKFGINIYTFLNFIKLTYFTGGRIEILKKKF